jgi:hypothetical protein
MEKNDVIAKQIIISSLEKQLLIHIVTYIISFEM